MLNEGWIATQAEEQADGGEERGAKRAHRRVDFSNPPGSKVAMPNGGSRDLRVLRMVPLSLSLSLFLPLSLSCYIYIYIYVYI